MKVSSRYPHNHEPGSLRRRLAHLPSSVRWWLFAATLVVMIFIGWLGFQGLAAKANLEQARSSTEQARDALLAGASEDANRFAKNAQFHASQAREATHSFPWNAAAYLPVIGSPLKTTQQISEVVLGLADDILIPGAKAATRLSPNNLVKGTQIDLQLLRDDQPLLSALSAAASKLDVEAQTISKPAYLSSVANARIQLQEQTSRLKQMLGGIAVASKLAPAMLGLDGPRSYLLAFQNNAEARGTGGVLGAFGIIRFENGRPTVDTLSKSYELWDPDNEIDLGPEFTAMYGWMNATRDLRNANLSPHFPYAAQIWKSMWERQSGTTIDGVIALDPIAISYILGAIGSVTTPDGEVVSQENVVEFTESTVYSRFPSDNEARKSYLIGIARAVADRMTEPLGAPRKLLEAVGRAAAEGHIAVWSSSQSEQELIEKTPLSHVVPDDAAPYAQVIINNLAGNKMDYYLRREIEYVADNCDGDTRNSTITVRLANTAGNGPLPDYVAGAEGIHARIPLKVPSGTMISSVRVIATKGSRLMSVTSNGERTTAIRGMERGHPTFEVQLAIPRGKSGTLTFRLQEPTAPGVPRTPVQPLIDDVTPKVSVPACGP